MLIIHTIFFIVLVKCCIITVSIIFQEGKFYKILLFMNKNNTLDLSIVSDKWLSMSGLKVYIPPANVQTPILAKAHAEPHSTWEKNDIIIDFHTAR